MYYSRWGCHVLIGGYTEKDTDQPEIEVNLILIVLNFARNIGYSEQQMHL